MPSRSEYSRLDFIKIVTDVFDTLKPDKKNAYQLGMELARAKGCRIKVLVQEANALISSYISDLLVELFHPLLAESHESYVGVRRQCFQDFVQGVVKVG